MYRKTLALVLLGVLAVGSGTIAYGTFFDKGFAASVSSLTGGGDDEHHGRGQDRQHGDENDDDDDD